MKSKWTFGKLFAKKESWCIMLGIGIFNMTLQAVITQFFGSLLGMGVSQQLCMTYMVAFGLLGVVMSPIYGKLVDKLGAPKTGVVAAILYIVSVAGFAFHIPLVAATGLTFFVGSPILQPALTMHVFGGREYQAANRYITVGANIIAACGIPFMTIFYDITGSYTTAYYTLLVMNIFVLLLMLLCRNTYVED
jgi:predicted MFS family arabinose efflux permease